MNRKIEENLKKEFQLRHFYELRNHMAAKACTDDTAGKIYKLIYKGMKINRKIGVLPPEVY